MIGERPKPICVKPPEELVVYNDQNSLCYTILNEKSPQPSKAKKFDLDSREKVKRTSDNYLYEDIKSQSLGQVNSKFIC